MDPIAAVLCGAGAAVVLGGWGHESLIELCVLGATFYGISRATRSRVALGLVGALLVVWFLSHFWTFVPEKLLGTGFGEPNAEHHDAPTWWAEVLMRLTLLGSIVVARSKIGWGLRWGASPARSTISSRERPRRRVFWRQCSGNPSRVRTAGP